METKQLVIPVVVFGVIAVLRWIFKPAQTPAGVEGASIFSKIGSKIPKVAWPIIAPLLGTGLDYLMAYIGILQQTDPAMGALLGSAGVGVREIINQALTQAGLVAPREPEPPK
jgi:hypothetical protein